MKILDSNILFEAVSGQEQFEISYTLTTGRQTGSRVPADAFQENTSRIPIAGEEKQGIMVDRISISSAAVESYQKNYSSTVTATTRIVSGDTGETITSEQIHAVETLINGLIDKNDFRQAENSDVLSAPAVKPGGVPDQWQMSVTRTDIYYEASSMVFGAQGSVVTEDGRTIDFSLLMEMEQAFALEYSRTDRINIWQEKVTLTDPLVINLSGQAPELTDMTFSFDLNSDGNEEQISFLKPGSGFLVFDKNNDRTVNNGSELFGPDTGNGFEELAVHDEDGNNWIDENDAVFSQLYVWTKDGQGNDVLTSLKDAGIGAISLFSAAAGFDMKGSDNTLLGKIRQNGVFLFENGTIGSMQQVDLSVKKDSGTDTARPVSGEISLVPLPETMTMQSKIMEENGKRILKARLLDAQRFTGPVPEPGNRLKMLLDMVEKLKKEFEASLEKNYHREWGLKTYGMPGTAVSGFIPSTMDRIHYRL